MLCACLRPRAGSLQRHQEGIFISLLISEASLELVPFLPPPHSSPSHHLSGRNTHIHSAAGCSWWPDLLVVVFVPSGGQADGNPGFGGVALPQLLLSTPLLHRLVLTELLGSWREQFHVGAPC